MKTFSKKDQSFVCEVCGENVEALVYTSRDHCPNCLCSKHVDVSPGDRQNDCQGIMFPIEIETNSKKGYVIVYRCQKCGIVHRNKAANDDSFSKILSVMKGTYKF